MTSIDDMRHPERSPSMVAVLTYMTIGLGIWGLHLTLVYGAHTLICALGFGTGWSAAFIVAATALAVVPLLFILLGQGRFGRLLGLEDVISDRRTYDAISRFVTLLSLAGVLWSGATVAFVSSCTQGR